jgi:hypothetical protein
MMYFDWKDNQIQDLYDQPSKCKIFFYVDGTNTYSNIDQTHVSTDISNER